MKKKNKLGEITMGDLLKAYESLLSVDGMAEINENGKMYLVKFGKKEEMEWSPLKTLWNEKR